MATETDILRRQVEDLRLQLEELRGLVEFRRPSVFLAKPVPAEEGEEGTRFKEHTVKDEDLVEFVDGREDALIDPSDFGDAVIVLAVEGRDRFSYVKIAGDTGFWARIDGSTQDGGNKRWKYDFTEIRQATAGYGGWAVLPGGRTGTNAGGNPLYNAIEDQNGASGTFGNGIDSANLVGSIEIRPIPTGTPVWVRAAAVADGTVTYWTKYENGVDGNCGD